MSRKSKDNTFVWSNGWWLEDSKAWFICGMSNVLFCIDFNTGQCEKLACIPELCECTYRQNPYCIKSGKDIFCIPGFAQNIWIYNLDSRDFKQVRIDKPEGHQLGDGFWIWRDMLYLVPGNWNKIVEIDMTRKEVITYYTICEDDSFRKSVLIDDCVYIVSYAHSRIYQFDLVTKKIELFTFDNFDRRFYTICFDGKKFWMSGYHKEVYVWDKRNDSLATINNLPMNYEMYALADRADRIVDYAAGGYKYPIFGNSVVVGDYVWFIPALTDKIMYADKNSDQLYTLEIDDECETKEKAFLRELWAINNYLLEYVRCDRYIGLFSIRSGRVLEIDAQELTYQWKNYNLRNKHLFQCGRGRTDQMYCSEENGVYELIYCIKDYQPDQDNSAYKKNVGVQIYNNINGKD